MATHSKSGTTITAYNADMLDGYHADEFVKGEGGTLVDLVYPVGAIYMSINPASPSLLLGGTWATWGTGRVPVGVDTTQTEFNTVQKTGGAKTHTLTTAEMPAHNHPLKTGMPAMISGDNIILTALAGGTGTGLGRTASEGGTTGASPLSIENRGGGAAHNNLQPYITCYMWVRTA